MILKHTDYLNIEENVVRQNQVQLSNMFVMFCTINSTFVVRSY